MKTRVENTGLMVALRGQTNQMIEIDVTEVGYNLPICRSKYSIYNVTV